MNKLHTIKKHLQTSYKEEGVSIVEAIVVISVLSVSFAAILSAILFFLRGGLYATDEAQALFLLDESAEAIRFLRDESYTTNIVPLVGAGTRYFEPYAGTLWTATTTNTPVLGKFTRSFTISEVYRRNSDDDIIPFTSVDPKTLDTGTVKLDVTVSWPTGSVTGTTYVADLYEN